MSINWSERLAQFHTNLGFARDYSHLILPHVLPAYTHPGNPTEIDDWYDRSEESRNLRSLRESTASEVYAALHKLQGGKSYATTRTDDPSMSYVKTRIFKSKTGQAVIDKSLPRFSMRMSSYGDAMITSALGVSCTRDDVLSVQCDQNNHHPNSSPIKDAVLMSAQLFAEETLGPCALVDSGKSFHEYESPKGWFTVNRLPRGQYSFEFLTKTENSLTPGRLYQALISRVVNR